MDVYLFILNELVCKFCTRYTYCHPPGVRLLLQWCLDSQLYFAYIQNDRLIIIH